MAKFRGFNKTCVVCSAPFRVSPSLDRVTTCSRECGYKVRRVANKTEHVKLKCAHCGVGFTEPPSHASRRVYCSVKCREQDPAMRAKRSAQTRGAGNPQWKGGASVAVVSESGKQYRRQQPHIEAEKSVRRRRATELATPAWADLTAIRAIYREAARLTKETGQPHHVDHVVPLNSPVVCGLHNQFNLQVLPAFLNLSKGNRLSA